MAECCKHDKQRPRQLAILRLQSGDQTPVTLVCSSLAFTAELNPYNAERSFVQHVLSLSVKRLPPWQLLHTHRSCPPAGGCLCQPAPRLCQPGTMPVLQQLALNACQGSEGPREELQCPPHCQLTSSPGFLFELNHKFVELIEFFPKAVDFFLEPFFASAEIQWATTV